jgi:hypothetical protein
MTVKEGIEKIEDLLTEFGKQHGSTYVELLEEMKMRAETAYVAYHEENPDEEEDDESEDEDDE